MVLDFVLFNVIVAMSIRYLLALQAKENGFAFPVTLHRQGQWVH
jgi:hypothetical protein